MKISFARYFNISIQISTLFLAMPRLLMIFFLIAIKLSSQAQVSDIISVQKKNGRTIKNFYEASRILFQTKEGEYVEGPIAKIYHDSIYVRMYVIQKMMSAYGSYMFDTLNTYLVSKNYKDISRISVYSHHREMRRLIGSSYDDRRNRLCSS